MRRLKSKAILIALPLVAWMPNSSWGLISSSGPFPCDQPPSRSGAPIRFIAQGLICLRDAPEGTEIAELQGNTSVRLLAEHAAWDQVELQGWVRSENCQPAVPEDTVKITKECYLTDEPGGITREGDHRAMAIANLVPGGHFPILEVKQDHRAIRLIGWVESHALRTDPDERIIPPPCTELTMEAMGESTRVFGQMKFYTNTAAVAFRMRLYDYCGNRVGPESEFEVRLSPALGGRSGGLPFDVTLPVPRSLVATCRIATGERYWGWR
jgi:hypothetical protein